MNKENPLVSIIVRTKDRPKLLKRALQSISDQTYRPIEVVLVNDGGPSLNVEELRSILGTVSLNYIQLEKNKGRAFAGNVGIDNAGGEYAGFLDDDDIFYDNHVSTIIGFLIESDSHFAYTDAYIVKHCQKKEGYIPYAKELAYGRDFDKDWLLFQNYMPFLCFLAKRELLVKERFDLQFDLFEDWDFLIRLSQHTRFHRIPEVTAEYHLRDDNTILDLNPNTFAHIEARYKVYRKNMNLITERGIRIFETLHTENEYHKALLKEKESELHKANAYMEEKEKEMNNIKEYIDKKESELNKAQRFIEEKEKEILEMKTFIQTTENSRLYEIRKNKIISIVILTYNGGKYIKNLLDSIFAQQIDGSLEVILIDSSSGDDTCQLAKSYDVKMQVIDKALFSHSKTRNLGISLSSGDFIFFITQDALPVNRFWLKELLKPFKFFPDLAASYSRQIPNPDCNPIEARDIYIGAPCIDEIRCADVHIEFERNDYFDNIHRYIRFSNVSACYRGDLLRNNLFDERLKMVEDQEWSKRMIENGHSIYYASKSIVVHSHNFTAKESYDRFFDYGSSFKKFIVNNPPRRISIFKSTAYDSINDAVYIINENRQIRSKLKWICMSPFLRFAANYGLYKGWKCG